MRLPSIITAAALAVTSAGAASAATMTFSGLDSSIQNISSYTEDGITAVSADGSAFFWGYPSGGQLHFDPAGFSDVSYDFTFAGGQFDLASLDFTCCGSSGATAILTAYDALGAAFKTGSFDASASGSLAFADWTGITRLNITDTFNHFSIDNLTLSASAMGAVPEPASWAMMIGGFGLAGGAIRRRQRQTVRLAHA